MNFDCIVVGSHLRFDGVWQRPQHIATRLAEHVPVLFVEEPFRAATDRDDIRAERGLSVLRPSRQLAGVPADPAVVRSVRAWAGSRRALVWLYTPTMRDLAGVAWDGSVVYDCMDELAAFAFAPPGLAKSEALLLEQARLVFAGGRSLYEARRRFGPKVRLYPSGVEFEHFSRARSLPPHPVLAPLSAPVCGYVGVIDERIEIPLLGALADRGANVVLVGPVVKIDPALLPRRTNVHLTGQVPYDDLPSFLAGFDVALMPFAQNASTAFISPTKTPEYLASGTPVVSTGVRDVVATYGDVVTFADSPEAFADACMTVRPDPGRIALGISRARAAGWDAIVQRMWTDLERE